MKNPGRADALAAQVLLDEGAQRAGGYGAAMTRDFAAAAHEDHGRDGLNVETRGELGLCVGVYLGQPDTRLKFACGRFKYRRHGAAGPAPSGPEIDQQRQIGSAGVPLEMSGIEIDRSTGKQRLMALAAFAAFAASFGWNAVQRVTMRTGNGDGCSHGRSQSFSLQREPRGKSGAQQHVDGDRKDDRSE